MLEIRTENVVTRTTDRKRQCVCGIKVSRFAFLIQERKKIKFEIVYHTTLVLLVIFVYG